MAAARVSSEAQLIAAVNASAPYIVITEHIKLTGKFLPSSQLKAIVVRAYAGTVDCAVDTQVAVAAAAVAACMRTRPRRLCMSQFWKNLTADLVIAVFSCTRLSRDCCRKASNAAHRETAQTRQLQLWNRRHHPASCHDSASWTLSARP